MEIFIHHGQPLLSPALGKSAADPGPVYDLLQSVGTCSRKRVPPDASAGSIGQSDPGRRCQFEASRFVTELGAMNLEHPVLSRTVGDQQHDRWTVRRGINSRDQVIIQPAFQVVGWRQNNRRGSRRCISSDSVGHPCVEDIAAHARDALTRYQAKACDRGGSEQSADQNLTSTQRRAFHRLGNGETAVMRASGPSLSSGTVMSASARGGGSSAKSVYPR